MSEIAGGSSGSTSITQTDFERISAIVSVDFQVEQGLLEFGIPTYYLKMGQQTKEPFLRVLRSLEPLNLIAVLRKVDSRIVLRVVAKPQIKPSNVLINWALFFATIATTFVTGYILSEELVAIGAMPNAFIGGAAFAAAIMAVLGMHEMGHKLTANRNKVEATPPYFIPGLPPNIGGFGTFGAVIMQKSLPPNRDSLFDVGSAGPIVGFFLALVVSVIGLLMSPMLPVTGNEGFLPIPLVFDLLMVYVVKLPQGYYLLAHPVAFAGWVGMIVTMLNLLPAGMLDGGHVARSMGGGKSGIVLTAASILYLFATGFYPMALLVLFMSMYKHPGPLDDVSSLSSGRKLLTLGLIGIFILSTFWPLPFL